MDLDIELVYYQLFSKEVHYGEIENAKHFYNLGKECSSKQLCAISIKENNKVFLQELEETVIPKGYEYLDFWLRGLISSYVKRKSLQNGDTPYYFEYYDSWLKNTRLLLNGKYPVIEKWCDEYENLIRKSLQLQKINGSMVYNNNDRIFIVHGHDNGAKEAVARFFENQGLHPIILHEQVDESQTIIEKIENNIDVGYAIILYTPCDLGKENRIDAEYKPRARQNVLFEHGYLIGKLGRKKVCALIKGDIETPSDISGMIYKTMDDKGYWKIEIAKEMKAMGYNIDMNKIK